MKNKKIFLIILIIIIAIITLLFLMIDKNSNKIEKFYIEDEYYNSKGLTEVTKEEVEKMLDEEKSFILFVDTDFCTLGVPCEDIFKEISETKNIEILQISFTEFKETKLYDKVKYGPTVLIIKKGKIIDYLDANSEEHKELYQNTDKFYEWLTKYILIK